jgi:hypothetical protein
MPHVIEVSIADMRCERSPAETTHCRRRQQDRFEKFAERHVIVRVAVHSQIAAASARSSALNLVILLMRRAGRRCAARHAALRHRPPSQYF